MASRSSTAHEYRVSRSVSQSTYLSHRKGSWYLCSSTLHCAAALIRSGVQKLGSGTSIGDPTPVGYENAKKGTNDKTGPLMYYAI